MDYPLKKQQIIYLLLLKKLNVPEIAKYIVLLMNQTELNDSLSYHIERWETISSKYFKSFEKSLGGDFNPYSYVIDSKKYVYENDRVLDFYKETNIPFQCRDLLLHTIKNEFINDDFFDNHDLQDNLNEENTKCRKEKDKLYGTLSNYIMNKMKLL